MPHTRPHHSSLHQVPFSQSMVSGLRPLCGSISLATLLLSHCLDNAISFAPPTACLFRRNLSISSSTTAAAATTTPHTSRTVSIPGWQYKGHAIHTEVSVPSKTSLFESSKNVKPTVLLIHGFACSTTYWRETTSALTERGYQVHSVDLLGQGKSAKPGRADNIEYSIQLWADMCDCYARDNIKGDVVLMGNSLGSVVALTAASGDFANGNDDRNDDDDDDEPYLRNCVIGICMFNCGVGMNIRGIPKDEKWTPIQRFLINAWLDVLDLLIFGNTVLLGYVLNNVVTKDLLRDTLQSLYKYNPERVDDELVDSFYYPAKETGSVEVLSQIYTNDPGSTPMQIHARHGDFLNNLPIQLVWGNDDSVTPLSGGVGQFYESLATDQESKVTFQVVESGHVPFDDNPEESNGAMLQWLEGLVGSKGAAKQEEDLFRGFRRLFGK